MARKKRTKGEGTIFYSDSENRWIAEITLPTGKKKKKRTKDKQSAADWLFEQRKAISDFNYTLDSKTTLNEFCDRYLEEVARHTLKPKTYDTYESYLRLHVRPEIGRMKLSSLQSQHIQSLLSRKIDDNLSKKTVLHIHATLRKVLNEAVKKGLIIKNPCDGVTPPRVEKQVPTVWTIDEAKIFLDAVREHRWFGIYLIALTTGMRRGEILGMMWENINWATKTITITKTVVELRGKATVTTPKTKTSRRRVRLPDVVIDHLKRKRQSKGWIFPSELGNPLSPRNLLRHYYSVLENLDIPKIRFHDLRHTAATILLTQNVHPKIVQELLGHASIVQTLDGYSPIIRGANSTAAEEMDSVFGDL